jgi:prepilin-type N-terminal cleavage/methylation domain-containing protein
MRKGLSLIEFLVAIAILAVLMALLLPAIQKAREAALTHESLNNLRQITLATANVAGHNENRLPSLNPGHSEMQVFVSLLPFLERAALYDWLTGRTPVANYTQNPINQTCRTFLNPLDPSTAPVPAGFELSGVTISSYACNAQVFTGRPRVDATFSDGLSTTILFTEHYGWNCGGEQFHYPTQAARPRYDPIGIGRASFADGGPLVGRGRNNCGDYYPMTSGDPPVSVAEGGRTFQLRPALADCDPRLPNSSSSRGLQVAMADGSVRIIAPSISPAVFWGAVTPRGGEAISLD